MSGSIDECPFLVAAQMSRSEQREEGFKFYSDCLRERLKKQGPNTDSLSIEVGWPESVIDDGDGGGLRLLIVKSPLDIVPPGEDW